MIIFQLLLSLKPAELRRTEKYFVYRFKIDSIFALKDDSLWACLAAMSAYAKELSTAEIAYAAIEEVSLSLHHRVYLMFI